MYLIFHLVYLLYPIEQRTLRKAVSAIPVGLKCETRYISYSYSQRDSLAASTMEEILSQSMISVTVYDEGNVAKVSVTVCDGVIARIFFSIGHGGKPC
jgi:hypothetical protein